MYQKQTLGWMGQGNTQVAQPCAASGTTNISRTEENELAAAWVHLIPVGMGRLGVLTVVLVSIQKPMPHRSQAQFNVLTLYTWPYVPFPTSSTNSKIPAGSWRETNNQKLKHHTRTCCHQKQIFTLKSAIILFEFEGRTSFKCNC